MSEPDTDWALVAAVKAGDERAFDALMARYKRPVLSFVYRMLGDMTEAEDVAQSVFAGAYWSLLKPAFRQADAKFSTWLFRVARNAALDSLRHTRRHPAQSLATLDSGGESIAADGRTAREDVAARETGARIAAAVARLPPNQRTALVLAEYEQLSCADIAAIMDCSPKSVEALLYRARQSLRDWLQPLLA